MHVDYSFYPLDDDFWLADVDSYPLDGGFQPVEDGIWRGIVHISGDSLAV